MSDYQRIFKLNTQDILSKACKYVLGLFGCEKGKRNIERMVEQNDENYQSQQHFISDSPWDAREAMKVVAQKANKSLGVFSKQSLNIDECSNKKAGKHSVGVSRQHNGNLGKIENSQTGVYASLGAEDKVCLVNCRLFLAKEWVEDKNRCKKAGIPPKDIKYKTKPELAIEMIKEMDQQGIYYGWIGADGLYGSSYDFCKSLDELGKKFVVDVHRDQHVYLNEPRLYVPEKKELRGRSYKKLRTAGKSVEVQQYVSSLKEDDFTEIKARKGTKGWIKSKFHIKQVWVWDKKESQCRKRTLVVKKDNKAEKIKYSLSNIDIEEQSINDFAYMQGQRCWIERAFQDNKGELGMADYQIRKYNSWYHHQALVMIAMHYVMEIRIENKEKIPLLSVRDVRLQIIALLKRQGVYIEKEIDQMINRHNQRARDIARYYT